MIVLDEITSSLIDQQMMTELLKTPEISSHESMKEIIDHIAQASIMRLDSVSMDRLWDLITMVFKWQITISRDIIAVTTRHLYEIETFTTNPETQLQLHRIQNIIDNFNKVLSPQEKIDLTEHIIIWLHNFNVRVSLLLRLGFQNQDGSFKTKNFNPKYATMLNNIGENIYFTTQNCKLTKPQPTSITNKSDGQSEKQELKTMIDQILGEDNNQTKMENAQVFKLSMCDNYEDAADTEPKNMNIYSEIAVSNSTSTFQDMFNDLNTNEDGIVSNIHDELLNIIDENNC